MYESNNSTLCSVFGSSPLSVLTIFKTLVASSSCLRILLICFNSEGEKDLLVFNSSKSVIGFLQVNCSQTHTVVDPLNDGSPNDPSLFDPSFAVTDWSHFNKRWNYHRDLKRFTHDIHGLLCKDDLPKAPKVSDYPIVD